MKKWSRSMMLSMTMASLVLSSCGSSPEEYETMASSADTIDFREWCKQQKLLKCDAPTNTTIPLK
jgi:hypothetical protein